LSIGSYVMSYFTDCMAMVCDVKINNPVK
jgi:hypothetical protein